MSFYPQSNKTNNFHLFFIANGELVECEQDIISMSKNICDRVVYGLLFDRVVYGLLSDRVVYGLLSNRVVYGMLSDRVVWVTFRQSGLWVTFRQSCLWVTFRQSCLWVTFKQSCLWVTFWLNFLWVTFRQELSRGYFSPQLSIWATFLGPDQWLKCWVTEWNQMPFQHLWIVCQPAFHYFPPNIPHIFIVAFHYLKFCSGFGLPKIGYPKSGLKIGYPKSGPKIGYPKSGLKIRYPKSDRTCSNMKKNLKNQDLIQPNSPNSKPNPRSIWSNDNSDSPWAGKVHVRRGKNMHNMNIGEKN